MPKVGNKSFPYTKAGKKAAGALANKMGKPMKMMPDMAKMMPGGKMAPGMKGK